MDEPEDQPTTHDLTDGVSKEPAADLFGDVRNAFERLGKDVIATAEDVSSGRRPVLPDSLRSSLADLASGLATLADNASRSLEEWSRALESDTGSASRSESPGDSSPS